MFNGAAQTLTSQSLVVWWFCLSLDLFIRVVGPSLRWTCAAHKLRAFYHTLGWCLPLITMIAALATNAVGGVPIAYFCGVNEDTKQWIFIFGPVTFFGVFGGWIVLCAARLCLWPFDSNHVCCCVVVCCVCALASIMMIWVIVEVWRSRVRVGLRQHKRMLVYGEC